MPTNTDAPTHKLQVLLCSADTCNKCRMIKPHLESIVASYPGVEFREIQDINILASFNVTVAPTVILLRCESEYDRIVDIQWLDTYRERIDILYNDKWE